jgi:NAD(P)-dependent dehydrogenase (short-subunit alcohol dehydrogenase family)
MSKPVAIVTGAASGMGLALTKHLLFKGWRVAMADIDAASGIQLSNEFGPDTYFQRTDVSLYADQAELFNHAFKWGGNRLDFFAANAGIDDKQSLYEKNEAVDMDHGGPKELNLKTIRVDLEAVIQGIWLFKYYARKNTIPGGKIAITSSAAGL